MHNYQGVYGVFSWREWQAGSAELFNIVASRRGNGRHLIPIALAEMKQLGFSYVYLFSEAHNRTAHEFFERQGFKRLVEIDGFYSYENGIMFGRQL